MGVCCATPSLDKHSYNASSLRTAVLQLASYYTWSPDA